MGKENETKVEMTKRRLDVLVALDNSQVADLVVKRTAQYVMLSPFNLTLLTVIPNVVHGDESKYYIPDAQSAPSGYLFERQEEAKRILAKAGATLKDYGIECKTKIVVGPVAEEIVRVAKEGKFDIIIMGSRGLEGMKRLLLGSVAEQVMRRAHCSVTIIR